MRELFLPCIASVLSWFIRLINDCRTLWFDFLYPPDVPYISSVLAISNDDVPLREKGGECMTSDEVHEWMDLTDEYKTNKKIDIEKIRKHMSNFRIEYRYLFKRCKYRYTVDPSMHEISFPDEIESREAFVSKPIIARMYYPEGTDESVIKRVAKYAGPSGDFYGGTVIRAQWLFPWFTAESFDGVSLHIVDSHLRMHVFRLDENPFLSLK